MFSKRGWRVRLVALVLAGPALLAGCGDDEAPQAEDPTTSSPSASQEETVPADAPECADVWQEGAELPRRYHGCVEDGELVEPDARPCSSGQRMVRYGDRYYGVLGGTVHETPGPLKQDKAYRAALRSCTA